MGLNKKTARKMLGKPILYFDNNNIGDFLTYDGIYVKFTNVIDGSGNLAIKPVLDVTGFTETNGLYSDELEYRDTLILNINSSTVFTNINLYIDNESFLNLTLTDLGNNNYSVKLPDNFYYNIIIDNSYNFSFELIDETGQITLRSDNYTLKFVNSLIFKSLYEMQNINATGGKIEFDLGTNLFYANYIGNNITYSTGLNNRKTVYFDSDDYLEIPYLDGSKTDLFGEFVIGLFLKGFNNGVDNIFVNRRVNPVNYRIGWDREVVLGTNTYNRCLYFYYNNGSYSSHTFYFEMDNLLPDDLTLSNSWFWFGFYINEETNEVKLYYSLNGVINVLTNLSPEFHYYEGGTETQPDFTTYPLQSAADSQVYIMPNAHGQLDTYFVSDTNLSQLDEKLDYYVKRSFNGSDIKFL